MPKLTDEQAQKADEGGEEFEPVPPGAYVAVLNQVTEKPGNAAPYWEWEFVLTHDADGNELEVKPKLWENTSTSERAVWRIAQMMAAFGRDSDADTDELVGEYVGVNVGQEIAQQGVRAGQLRNIFLSAFPVESE